MISRYQENAEKYQRIVQVINNVEDKALQKSLKKIGEKYKICIECMEEKQVEEIILRCIEMGSSILLEKTLHSVIFTRTIDTTYGIYNHNPGSER
ncbi:MAG: hypothetical protein HFJ37_01965 [Clostridia bacterium]|nr:hypothetical protein [Clostridia bacterium]